jgi:hypothetical protein
MSLSAHYGYSEEQLQEMLLYASRGKLPMASYKLGSDVDSAEYISFLEGVSSVIRGQDPTNQSNRQKQDGPKKMTLPPSLALPAVRGAKKKETTGLVEVASKLPREKQMEVLGALDQVEYELAGIAQHQSKLPIDPMKDKEPGPKKPGKKIAASNA